VRNLPSKSLEIRLLSIDLCLAIDIRISLSEMITVTHRDICGKFRENEAGFDGIATKSIDSVFFDLPEPWLALPYALHVLKPTRPICCYSPCIEQVYNFFLSSYACQSRDG
jgi:tRNA A58 N-methylase Trm61